MKQLTIATLLIISCVTAWAADFEKGFAEDHRGSLEFYNDIKLDKFKRFYIVNNPKKGTVRAWHGHKIEAKLVKVLKGEFVVCTIKIDNWESPNKGIKSTKFTMPLFSAMTGVV